ncbi:uncharacterized protein LOC107845784 [Capsicum annuum]|uniref:uncharacterized protein LOC107845784 n=1 Tax=Capsicum annuum TaxID=4072 RepID=UPI001FB18598|nr:uncharacterized protein LOC107845784 [Capsicum annuum]
MVDSIHSSTCKKLYSGKLACFVCPHRPVLDPPPPVHVKGSSHRAAESRLRERELRRQTEINKRIALSGCDTATSRTLTSIQLCRSASKPLIERTRKDASDILLQNLAQSTASQVDESSVADGGNS